jgi:exonuclease VII large subunit
LNELLASARDAASSAAAFAKIPPLLRRVEELNNERRILESQGARLSPQKQQQLDASTKALESQQLERMSQQVPQYLELMEELTKEVSPGGPPKKKQP